jgi:DNA/RNA-binding domain of Phe-tRNA-synthetase-like protein
MPEFQYHSDILARFPLITGGVILASGMKNSATPPALQEIYFAEQQAVLQRIGNTPLSELPTLVAWRSAFRAFGVNPTQYRSAVEALLRRLTKKGDIPSINTLVDLCNLVSIRHALPVAAFDTRALTGALTVQFADGSEHFTPLFEQVAEHPEPGEVIFADERKLVAARRWCWRQSDESATRADTTEAIFTIEAQHADGRDHGKAALQDLLALLQTSVSGKFTWDLLDPQNPAIRG